MIKFRNDSVGCSVSLGKLFFSGSECYAGLVAVSPWKRDQQGLCYAGGGSEFRFYVVCYVVNVVNVVRLNCVPPPPPPLS